MNPDTLLTHVVTWPVVWQLLKDDVSTGLCDEADEAKGKRFIRCVCVFMCVYNHQMSGHQKLFNVFILFDRNNKHSIKYLFF